MAVNALPGREMTFSSIACVTLKWLVSGSGWASCSFSKLVSDQPTKPSGAFLRTIRRFFFSSSPARASSRAFSTSWSGASATTVPTVS